MNAIFEMLKSIKQQIDIDCFNPVIKVQLIKNSLKLKITALIRGKIYCAERIFTEREIINLGGNFPHEIAFFCNQVNSDVIEKSKNGVF